MRPEKVIEGLKELLNKDPGRPIYEKERKYLEEAIKYIEWFMITENDYK